MKRISKKIPQHLDVGFEWDAREVWKVEAPVIEVPVAALLWHFDEPFWDVVGTDDFNLTPWQVLKEPEIHTIHYSMILEANLAHPIDAMEHDGKLRILDGIHRLAKAYIEGRQTVAVRIIPTESIPRL